MEFYKAKLLQIKLLSRPSRFMYWRLANASQVFFLWFDISWRRSWLPQAAYAQGWDAAFRQFHGIDESGRTPRALDSAFCTCEMFMDSGRTDPATCEFCGKPHSH